MITLTNEMLEAINIIENTNQSLYITGKAGTGKTTFLRYIVTNIKAFCYSCINWNRSCKCWWSNAS